MSDIENSAAAAGSAQAGSAEHEQPAAPALDKGKGKAKAVEPMEEEEDEEEEDSSDEELADDDDEDDNPLDGLDLNEIMPNARGGRKTRTQVDYASREAQAAAGLADAEPAASDDEEDEFKADESMDE